MWWRPAWFSLKGKGSIRGQKGAALLRCLAPQHQPPSRSVQHSLGDRAELRRLSRVGGSFIQKRATMPRKLRTTHLDFLSANPPAGHYGTVKRMRLAFLGVSHWHAGMHADAAKAAGAEAIAAWDPSPSAAAGFAQKHGCAAVASMDDAL